MRDYSILVRVFTVYYPDGTNEQRLMIPGEDHYCKNRLTYGKDLPSRHDRRAEAKILAFRPRQQPTH